MARYTIKNINNKTHWDDFLKLHQEANFLQSWEWGEFHLALGKKIQRTGFYHDDKLAGVMLSIVEPAKRGRYLTVPGGPILDWNVNLLVNLFVNTIRQIAKENNCVFVRVRPQLISDDFSRSLFKGNGFISAPLHLHAELTNQLNLSDSEEKLLANMRKATRYEIRKSLTIGIKIKTSTDPDDIKAFYELQLQTAQRQKFVPFSFKFLYEQFKIFSAGKTALLYSAEFEGKLLAQALIIFYNKEAAYHYGASTLEGRKYPGAYLIQWEAIKEAKKLGMKIYNFWGVAPETDKQHRFYTISIFKRGFGGVDVEYLHAQDLVINKFLYLLNLAIELIRKKVRHV